MSNLKGFEELSVFLECSFNTTPTMASLKKYIDLIAEFGYTHFYLGLTDGYKIKGEPYFNFGRGGYTTEQLQEIDAYARQKGIEVRANIQVLGHLHYMRWHYCYRDLFDTEDILMVGKEEVYEFVEKMFATISAGLQSRTIHIGMDETFNLGLGRYLKENGYTERTELMLTHLQRVVEIAKKYGYTCEIWSDMFFRIAQGDEFKESGVIPEGVRESIPEGVRLVHFGYGKKETEELADRLVVHKALCDEVLFAGGAWKQHGLAPDNAFSIRMIEDQIKTCREANLKHYMVTIWSNEGGHCSNFAILPTLFAAAEFARGKSKAEIDKDRFKEITGVAFDDFMLLDNMNNPFFKELDVPNNRCYWGLLSDVFMGTHDLMLDENTNEAYARLVKKYEAIQGGEYQLMFDDFILYAKVLSIKMNLGVQLRKAYREGDKEKLEYYAKTAIPQMIAYMQEYMEHFQKRWLSENMAFGLEVHHLYYGGQIERWKYVIYRLEQYLADGTPIEEMERDEIEASLSPEYRDEDTCMMENPRTLVSYCTY